MAKILDKNPPIPTRRLLLWSAQRLLLCLIFILSLSWYSLNPLTQIVDKILKWRPQKNILEVAIFIIIIFKSKLWQPHLHPPPKKKKLLALAVPSGVALLPITLWLWRRFRVWLVLSVGSLAVRDTTIMVAIGLWVVGIG